MMTLNQTLPLGRSKAVSPITLAQQGLFAGGSTSAALRFAAKLKPREKSYVVAGGFTLIELMIAMVLGLLIVLALTTLFVNISRTNNEMAKANAQIENGRFAMQLLQGDIVHGGYWGGFVPQFDDLTFTAVPGDAPTAVPDPCLTYNAANWTTAYKNNLIGIPVQSYESTTSICNGVAVDKKANTDVLVVRHANTCLPGAVNCEADIPGKVYFQTPLYQQEISASVQAATASDVTLDKYASAVVDSYKDSIIRIISGLGVGQTRVISAYNGTTKVASLTTAWATIPDGTSKYAIGPGNVLGTSGYVVHNRDGTTLADKRKFISNVYYISDVNGIPTLMRSTFDGTAPAHQPAVALIEGIEGFRVEFGIDDKSRCGQAVDYTSAITRVDPALSSPTTCTANTDTTKNTLPQNRGDGVPDTFVRCPAAGCTVAQLANVVAVKLYVLARNKDVTPGYTDTKTYTLGVTTLGPFNDNYKRHVFTTTVRLTNISGRRDTP